jgi:hypothetical protein
MWPILHFTTIPGTSARGARLVLPQAVTRYTIEVGHLQLNTEKVASKNARNKRRLARRCVQVNKCQSALERLKRRSFFMFEMEEHHAVRLRDQP